jgi:hypothetical protein
MYRYSELIAPWITTLCVIACKALLTGTQNWSLSSTSCTAFQLRWDLASDLTLYPQAIWYLPRNIEERRHMSLLRPYIVRMFLREVVTAPMSPVCAMRGIWKFIGL